MLLSDTGIQTISSAKETGTVFGRSGERRRKRKGKINCILSQRLDVYSRFYFPSLCFHENIAVKLLSVPHLLSWISKLKENDSSLNECNSTTRSLRAAVIQELYKCYEKATRKRDLCLIVCVYQALYKAFIHFVLNTVIKFPTERLEDQDQGPNSALIVTCSPV